MQKHLRKHLHDKFQLAYLRLDSDMCVLEVSDNLTDYGFDDVPIGADASDHLDFLVGLNAQLELELPMVSSPAGTPISVSLMPAQEQLTVIISNAAVQAAQREQLQQAANENELLLEQQKRLMAELESASEALAEKNHQLEEASRLQTSFLSGVSHEFRTPLTSIIGYTNLLHQHLQSGAKQPKQPERQAGLGYLRAVQRSSKHLLSLVENLLDHGKLDAEEIVIRPRVTTLREVFEDLELLFQPLCETKGIEFLVKIEFDQQLQVVIDDSRVRQCLINLVGNAVKFTDSGAVRLTAQFANDNLAVSIVDTGPGISEQDLHKIRLPFWQSADTGKAGTGLGLTITERLIEMMGGQLDIASQLARGTTVSVSMLTPEYRAEDDPQAELKQQGLRVLLAEDDRDIADLVCVMLRQRGLHVTHAENGALALNALAADNYDLVLMDIHMPSMTGYQAVAEMRARNDQTPVVIMSASALDNDRSRAEQLNCNGYLVKPIDVDDLLTMAGQVVS